MLAGQASLYPQYKAGGGGRGDYYCCVEGWAGQQDQVCILNTRLWGQCHCVEGGNVTVV